MIFDIYYGNGDKVEYVRKIGEVVKHTCGFCDGQGLISGHDNSVITCPICHGNGFIETDERETEIVKGYIHDIKVFWDRMSGKIEITYLVDTNWVDQTDILHIIRDSK